MCPTVFFKREMFYFDGGKVKTVDKVNFCNKCQSERMNNRVEASVCQCGYSIF